jgi:S-adenosylmethionine hydrolase
MKKIFGLITDFGFDFAVASIKGVLLKHFPDAHILDIDHSIDKFNILNAAFVIDKIFPFLPESIIVLCVIDPGVGTERDLLCIEMENRFFVGPNNGVFHYLLEKLGATVYTIKTNIFIPQSVTFHGRDIFAPAAIALAHNDSSILVPFPKKDCIYLSNLGNGITEGVITYIDSFGNIKTNLLLDNFTLQTSIKLLINHKSYNVTYTQTFHDVKPQELLCYKGSNATLEIAVNLGSAQKDLDVHIGDKIIVQ